MLEIDDGDILTQTTAICQFLASTGAAPQLLGTNPFETAQVEQWVSFLRTKTLTMSQQLSYSVFGLIEMDSIEYAHISNMMRENVKILNKQLENKEWLCGTENPTIADYQMALATMEQYQCIMDTNTIKSLNHFNKFMKKVSQLPEFKDRMGNIKPGKKQIMPIFAAEEEKVEKAINAKAAMKKK